MVVKMKRFRLSDVINRVVNKENELHLTFLGVILSLLLSGFALSYSKDANNIAKANITTQLAMTLGSDQVTKALFAVTDALEQPPETGAEYDTFLEKVQPLKRSLEAIGICIELETCYKEHAIKFACDEALSLTSAYDVAAEVSEYDEYEENDFHGFLGLCRLTN